MVNPDVRPKRQDFSNYYTRVRSYEHAPDLQALKGRLVEAGLYYSGPGAQLRCFSCGIILDCLDRTMKLWKLHACRSPNCAYLLEVKGERRMRRAVRDFANQESITTNNTEDNEVLAEHPATGRHQQSLTWNATSTTQQQAFPRTAHVCSDASGEDEATPNDTSCMSRSEAICPSAVMSVVTRYDKGCLCISMSEQDFFNVNIPDPSSSKEGLVESLNSLPLSVEEMQTFLDLFPLLRGCKVFSNIDLPRPCPILTTSEMGVFVVYEDARSRGDLNGRLGHFIAVQINTIIGNEVHVTIFDHLHRKNNEINQHTLRLIAKLLNLRPGTTLTVHKFPVQNQISNWDCGPFVLNDIIYIRNGKEDGLRALFDQIEIRSHLRFCVQTDTCTCLDPIQCKHVRDEPCVTHSYEVNSDGSVVARQ
ncbi:uncharacterized protein LOC110451572 [Mizuhopecten yessoensis]|uniref:uncharacterized protein LOC110451572 n=1 Tax=Mizuhopecten yessoensis TaxID=6573 RepID=UPI000B45ED38|nr:uncharacterized protein LOC110451572 [Mizuhopecten yessoensis]